ncbi:MAG TPA: ATP-binding protein, partial [Anaerolineales bacterium]|nr:ATP-binding protein [Anaerolineales bacterium]
IQQQVQRAASLIRQILDFSRRSVMEQADLDLLPFIKELGKLLGRVLPENLRLETIYKPGFYLVRADPTRLQQAFMNLALNARDAMPFGGLLRFSLERVQTDGDDRAYPQDLPPGKWIYVQVMDTGVGVKPEILPRIFDPFFTTKPVGQGAGLGLAQVYGIIKQHGGSIYVHSKEGKGTSFDIFLPALAAAAQTPAHRQTAQPLSGAGCKVLVVEDDAAARAAMIALFEAQNYQVYAAQDGVKALELIEKTPETIELIVSDVVMPNMGGIELYKALAQEQPDVKFLFVTGHPLDHDDQNILEAGKVHWLMKPFTLYELNQAINALLKP